MPNVASWIRAKDAEYFRRAFAPHAQVKISNAAERSFEMEHMDGLLLSGGADIAAEFLKQEVPDPSVLEKDPDPVRDEWEFAAVKEALARELPIFAICKGMQLLNVALGGTLKLDIAGHNAPEMGDRDVQALRTERTATHRLEKVNSSHHQALDRLGEGCAVEAWCVTDDIIEQVRMKNFPFGLAVQYHPERGGEIYAPLFADFAAHLKRRAGL